MSTQDRQRKHMAAVDELRSKQESAKANFASKVSEEKQKQKSATDDDEVTHKVVALARSGHTAVAERLGKQTHDLEAKAHQFTFHCHEAVSEHVGYLQARLGVAARVAETCIQTLQAHQNSVSALGVLDVTVDSATKAATETKEAQLGRVAGQAAARRRQHHQDARGGRGVPPVVPGGAGRQRLVGPARGPVRPDERVLEPVEGKLAGR